MPRTGQPFRHHNLPLALNHQPFTAPTSAGHHDRAMEGVYANLSSHGLAQRPEAAAARQLIAHGKRKIATVDMYLRTFEVYATYCQTLPADPYQFSVELAFLFAAYMLTRISRTGRPVQSLRMYFSAMNFCFKVHRDNLGEPWKGGAITDLNTMYERAYKLWAVTNNIRCGLLRTELPGQAIPVLLRQSKEAAAISAAATQHAGLAAVSTGRQAQCYRPQAPRRQTLAIAARLDAHQTVAWFAVFWIMLLFWFRADTIAGYQPGDIVFNEFGAMSFLVRRVKRGTAHVQPFRKTIPPPSNPLLREIFAVIRYATTLKDADDSFVLSAELWGTEPKRVSDLITDAMNRLLDSNDLFIAPGSFVSSHSWRKTGASAFAALNGDWHVIKRWGHWLSSSSAESYINDKFQTDPIFRLLFEFLLAPSATAAMDWAWAGYVTAADLAADGVFGADGPIDADPA